MGIFGLKILIFQRLLLGSNYIDSIADDTFILDKSGGCCILLRELELSSNNLVELSEAAFSGLQRLEALDLSSNRFRKIPSAALKQLKQLGILDFSDNTEMQVLSNSAFSGNKNLKELKLRGCRLRTIENNAFVSLGKMS